MDEESLAARSRASGAEHAPRPPLYVLYDETIDLSRFHARYWKSERDAEGRLLRRGLEEAARPGAPTSTLSERTGAELLSLVSEIHDAHVAYLLQTEPSPHCHTERGRVVLSEITAALEWIYDEGIEYDDARHPLRAARDDDPDSVEALANALDEYARLADQHRATLDGACGFDARLIDEAHEIAAALHTRTTAPALGPDAAAALARRARLVARLLQRMSLVRAAARFVFRDDPEILKQALSAYERRKHAAARRAAARRGPVPRIDAVTGDRATALSG